MRIRGTTANIGLIRAVTCMTVKMACEKSGEDADAFGGEFPGLGQFV